MVEFREYRSDDMVSILEVSKRAWAPVFKKLEPAVQSYVYSSFYPEGWWARQEADIRAYLKDNLVRTHVAVTESIVAGVVGTRLHPETGGDPGHKPSRSAYESMGFTRWPVARYFRELDWSPIRVEIYAGVEFDATHKNG